MGSWVSGAVSRALALLAVGALVAAVAGCRAVAEPQRASTDWSPATVTIDGLDVVAESDADGFRLHTASGDKTFLPGVNLGSTVPLHQPGEVGSIPADQYRTWFGQMGSLGIRVVRVYTLHPPAFYDELAAYNEEHPHAPIYLFQGAYLPDESYVEDGHTLYDPGVDDAFRQELHDLSDAVHGDLERPEQPGRAGGSWRTDVSKWLAGWIVGVEWDPTGVERTDTLERDATYRPGDYFVAQPDATPTERWIAGHMDALAGWEAGRGSSAPMAMANWPTTDPLPHPESPLQTEDQVSVDPAHVLPTDAWPGGTFASFHVYPYYPEFQRYEPRLRETRWRDREDPYAGYVSALRDHFAGTMPLLVTEFGAPSALGSAHEGPLGRDQGGHSEQEAMATDADLMRLLHAQGVAGGFVFAWEDEWFKRTWNTEAHQDPARRQLWHDPLTNEQWFGLVATDPDPLVDAAAEATPAAGPFEYLHVWADASWVHLAATYRDVLPQRLTIDADVVPEPAGADYRITSAPADRRAVLEVRRALDPMRLDTPERPYRDDQAAPWHRFQLLTNRSRERHGRTYPEEFQDVGALRPGSWDPASADFDSRSTWQVDTEHRTVRFRIPWSMLGLADPSSRTALGPGEPAALVPVDGIGLTFAADGGSEELRFSWPEWNHTTYTPRLKAGVDVLEQAFRDLAP